MKFNLYHYIPCTVLSYHNKTEKYQVLYDAGEQEYVRLEGEGAPQYRWLTQPTKPEPTPAGKKAGGAAGGKAGGGAGAGSSKAGREKKKRVRKPKAKSQPITAEVKA